MSLQAVACAKCGQVKPVAEFRALKRGPASKCRVCEAEYQREWRAASPEKARAHKRRYRETHREEIRTYKREVYRRDPEKARAANREWRERNPDKVAELNARNPEERRAGRLRRVHGISIDQFHEMWERQGGRCPICLRELPREFLTREELRTAPVKPHVDHCHATDVVRGVLCSTCNQAIGHLREDPENFRRAVEYLSGKFPTITPERSNGGPNGAKTHCPRGHAYDEANTRWEGSSRHCRACAQAPQDSQVAYSCPDCGARTSVPNVRCRSCAATRRWAIARGELLA